jgi:sugar phosphate isomerase/epimerase
MVGYPGHATTKPEHWETAFSFAKYYGANVDNGHFVAGNSVSPVAFIKQHRERITHLHLKDRKLHDGPNTPFGEGDKPIGEVLRLLRDNKWNIQSTIEFECKIPSGSDRMSEIARAIQYCRHELAKAGAARNFFPWRRSIGAVLHQPLTINNQPPQNCPRRC